MNFQVFARENCELCKKAQDVLSRAGVVPEVRYVEGVAATPENLADFAWFDWTDTPPLVVATDGDKIVGYYGDASWSFHGFVYTIPEPGTVLLLGLGGLATVRMPRDS